MVNLKDIKNNLELLEKEPLNVNANYLIAYYLASTKRIGEVYPYISKVIDSGVKKKGARLILGKYLWECEKKFVKATELYRQELKDYPDSLPAIANLALALAYVGEMQEAMQLHKLYLSYKPKDKIVHDLILMHSHYNPECTNEELLDYAEQRSKQLFGHKTISKEDYKHLNLSPLKPRLRIGFVSGDFKRHAVLFFIKDLFLELNKYCEVYCYCNNQADNATEVLKKEAGRWREIYNLQDEAVAALIKEDQIDILVDLSGNTGKNRLGLFALKPSPVQASWLGQAGPNGVKEIDYMLCNKDIVLGDEDKFYLEKPYRMNGVYAPFTAPHENIPVLPSPCLSNGYVTFGCFNNFMKVNNTVLDTWAEILLGVENSHLYLKSEYFADEDFREKIKNHFSNKGISQDRLRFEEYSNSKARYIVEYNNIDIALDPFPLVGGTTTNDLLWMGVPLITLSGNRMSQRISASMLKAIGTEELISYSKEEYINKAKKLAKDFKRIARYKNTLRTKYLNSAICNKPKFAKELMKAFSTMWIETISGLK